MTKNDQKKKKKDPSAIIGKGALIGPDVTIGPNCVIGEGVRIKNSVLLGMNFFFFFSLCLFSFQVMNNTKVLTTDFV